MKYAAPHSIDDASMLTGLSHEFGSGTSSMSMCVTRGRKDYRNTSRKMGI